MRQNFALEVGGGVFLDEAVAPSLLARPLARTARFTYRSEGGRSAPDPGILADHAHGRAMVAQPRALRTSDRSAGDFVACFVRGVAAEDSHRSTNTNGKNNTVTVSFDGDCGVWGRSYCCSDTESRSVAIAIRDAGYAE